MSTHSFCKLLSTLKYSSHLIRDSFSPVTPCMTLTAARIFFKARLYPLAVKNSITLCIMASYSPRCRPFLCSLKIIPAHPSHSSAVPFFRSTDIKISFSSPSTVSSPFVSSLYSISAILNRRLSTAPKIRRQQAV